MNVLITGANGFIGSNLMTMLKDTPDIKLFAVTRDNLNLYSLSDVENYINGNEITKIIHCAIEGNGRASYDTPEMVYKNQLMFYNLIHSLRNSKDVLINIASGAEFDRRNNIYREREDVIFYRVPEDYYGFAKNMIARNVGVYRNMINLRLFGCFYHNEAPDRFIRNNIIRMVNGEDIIIHQDRYMDFCYLPDLATLIHHLLIKTEKYELEHFDKDINMSYNTTYTLRQIADMINRLDWKRKSKVIIQNDGMAKAYCGLGYNLSIKSTGLTFKGLEAGICEIWENVLPNLHSKSCE